MSADTDPIGRFETVLSAEFTSRLLRASERTAFKGGPTFYTGIEPLPGNRHKVVLIDGADRLRAFIDKPPSSEIDGPRTGIVDQAGALEMIEGLLDLLARDLWKEIRDGKTLDARDVVFLKHWTEFRAPCGSRMSAEEAQRLFGDAPDVYERNSTLVGIDLLIDWEGPERVLGADPDYLHRKHQAQEAFGRAVSGAEEEFIAQCFVGFLAAMKRRTGDSP